MLRNKKKDCVSKTMVLQSIYIKQNMWVPALTSLPQNVESAEKNRGKLVESRLIFNTHHDIGYLAPSKIGKAKSMWI